MEKGTGHLDLRIADFGLSKDLSDPYLQLERCGTPTYIAPEILRG
jgi:serine/threonine protein kinase